MNLNDCLSIGKLLPYQSASGHQRPDRIRLKVWPSGDFAAGFVRSEQKSGQGLGLSVAPNLNKPQKEAKFGARRRPDGLSARGRRVVRSYAAIMERLYPRWRLSFTTLTILELGEAGLTRLLKVWPELVHRYYQELRRELARHDLPSAYFGVIEIQPKRLIRSGLPYPHLHIINISKGVRRSGPWLITPRWHRATWCRLISELSGVDVSDSPVENCQVPKKSLRNYLSKYLAKGDLAIEAQHLLKNSFCWSQRKLASWYSATRLLRGLLERSTTVYTIPAQVNFCATMKSLEDAGFLRFYPIRIEVGRSPPQTVGWVGWLSSDSAKHEVEALLLWAFAD